MCDKEYFINNKILIICNFEIILLIIVSFFVSLFFYKIIKDIKSYKKHNYN